MKRFWFIINSIDVQKQMRGHWTIFVFSENTRYIAALPTWQFWKMPGNHQFTSLCLKRKTIFGDTLSGQNNFTFANSKMTTSCKKSKKKPCIVNLILCVNKIVYWNTCKPIIILDIPALMEMKDSLESLTFQ